MVVANSLLFATPENIQGSFMVSSMIMFGAAILSVVYGALNHVPLLGAGAPFRNNAHVLLVMGVSLALAVLYGVFMQIQTMYADRMGTRFREDKRRGELVKKVRIFAVLSVIAVIGMGVFVALDVNSLVAVGSAGALMTGLVGGMSYMLYAIQRVLHNTTDG
jgi:hypothetical protein